ncbi:hypothetical protein HHI36_022078 [Cryptolaemus montrouzieri]|uniref:Uncharacterized protein n=1 Tax=Cryptolaemus montrouzieri TaxID=559131 RepID=A0ABD2MYN0_9CUCU
MSRLILLILLNSFLVLNVQADAQCNLNAIFRTPRKRNYDEFQILERSNFLSDESPGSPKISKQKPPILSPYQQRKFF